MNKKNKLSIKLFKKIRGQQYFLLSIKFIFLIFLNKKIIY